MARLLLVVVGPTLAASLVPPSGPWEPCLRSILNFPCWDPIPPLMSRPGLPKNDDDDGDGAEDKLNDDDCGKPDEDTEDVLLMSRFARPVAVWTESILFSGDWLYSGALVGVVGCTEAGDLPHPAGLEG